MHKEVSVLGNNHEIWPEENFITKLCTSRQNDMNHKNSDHRNLELYTVYLIVTAVPLVVY